MTLWTAKEAAQATQGRLTREWTASGVSIDTRTLRQGDLFVALQAERDGHDFVAQALERGAAAALISHVLVSILAYSLLTLAAFQAVLITAQENQLHHRHTFSLMTMLPPAQTMDAPR